MRQHSAGFACHHEEQGPILHVVCREKGEELRAAVEEWQTKRAVPEPRLTTGFLDGIVPIVDSYELKVLLCIHPILQPASHDRYNTDPSKLGVQSSPVSLVDVATRFLGCQIGEQSRSSALS